MTTRPDAKASAAAAGPAAAVAVPAVAVPAVAAPAAEKISESSLVKWMLIALVVFGVICLGALIYFNGVIADPSTSQVGLGELFGYIFAGIIGCFLGILTTKLS
jgi:hypothetical protein